MFQLFAVIPSYDDRDAISGWAAHAHPYSFVTSAAALAIGRAKGDDADPVYYVVVPAGASPFDSKAQVHRVQAVPDYADIPF